MSVQGVFVVQDFSFRWIAGISSSNEQHTKEMALLFLVFPCGVIRGALANLGLTAIVNADIPDVRTLPGCTSQLIFALVFVVPGIELTVRVLRPGLFNIKIKQG